MVEEWIRRSKISAEVGATAATFPSDKNLVSWVAHVRGMKRAQEYRAPAVHRKATATCDALAKPCAGAAVKLKGSILQLLYRRLLPRLGHNQAIWAVAHKLRRLIWTILHKGIRYEDAGRLCEREVKASTDNRMIRTLRKLGYQVEPPIIQPCALG